ncbi:MAG: hypothetical protein PHC64_04655 [Candidatus Gastranaerophilales bacterium]|nr:hypothetical protein [Candidatus Gastranaerophilales bacterium]
MKKVIEEILVRILGVMFGLGISFTGLILLIFGIAFCTSAIGILVGIPLIVYSFSLIFGGIIGGLKAVGGKYDFKFFYKPKKSDIVPKTKIDDLRWTYTVFKLDESYINN